MQSKQWLNNKIEEKLNKFNLTKQKKNNNLTTMSHIDND